MSEQVRNQQGHETVYNKQTFTLMDVSHFTNPALFDWLLADEVLDLVEPLLGPDIALWSSHFICKPPRGWQACALA